MKSLITVLFLLSTPLFAKEIVGVGIPPIAFLVESIGGERVQIVTALGEGQNPHSFNITPRTVIKLSKAKVYFSIDIPFESKIEQTIKKDGKTKIIELKNGLELLNSTSDHDHHGDHSTDDPHVWTTPDNLKIIARNIYNGLCKTFPKYKKEFSRNHLLLQDKINLIAEKIKIKLAPGKCKSIMVYHPSIKYLADAYGVKLLSVEYDGKAPTPRQLNKMIKKGKAHGITSVLIDSQLDPKSIAPITNILGGGAIPYNVMKKNVLNNLLAIADLMVKGAGLK
ncbi:MAG: zinc ABC transporter substrate-binding protein [Bacteriovoracaceae bacterium]|nr:zinc ABC transporter substrate-binding protein [Bacteriovoracaceae bacterium]